ncbi:MAG: adenosine deaminase [Bacteroidetes bacterium]|nr:adenosine deaminase [Bacteroidota bacterium]
MNYQSLPKIELHLHLDCSLSYNVVQKINPAITLEEYKESFIAPPKCTDLMDYLKRAVKGFEMMQTKEQLQLVTLDLMEQLKADNVIYAEIRFAPLLHIANGLTPQEVVQTINDALEIGIKNTGVEARLILCTLRQYNHDQSMITVKLVEQFKGAHVVGFDIAGDEAGYPVDAHVAAFEYAKANGIHVTSHGGEACGADSVWNVLENLHPSRIGHGVRSVEDEKLINHLKEKKIHLEVCPTSNVQTNVVDTIQDHPVDRIYRKGISMSINCDCRTISNVTLCSEYDLLHQTFGWDKKHFLHCSLEAITHAFCDEVLKDKLRKKVNEVYLGFEEM